MLGILGGMGPLATVDFMRKVVANTVADCDQEHLQTVVCSASNIPDRTNAILEGGPDPLPAMLETLRRLEGAGATYIAIPCNTAHNWHAELQAAASVRILHIADAVAEELARQGVHGGVIGLLATNGTLRANIYDERLSRRGFICKTPAEQVEVMRAIRLVKAGKIAGARTILCHQAQALIAAGCSHIVLACTEIPIALAEVPDELQCRLIDATDALSRACVKAYNFSGDE
jgi:aspartate racemase